MRTFALSNAKIQIFRNLIVCPHGKGDLASADILRASGEGSVFRDFVRTHFMDDP